jgi:hypothetical protein
VTEYQARWLLALIIWCTAAAVLCILSNLLLERRVRRAEARLDALLARGFVPEHLRPAFPMPPRRDRLELTVDVDDSETP